MEALIASKELAYTKVHYKYVVAEDLYIRTDIIGAAAMVKGFIYLRQDGWLLVKAGYAWDGPSGPTFDTPDFMAGSCVHDALYQLMRTRRLGQEWREQADHELEKVCKRAGMPWWRRKYVLWALRKFAGNAAKPRKDVVYKVAA